jgi:hypothetical protein
MPILLANPIILFIWHIHHRHILTHLLMWMIVAAIGGLVAALYGRMFALRAQDRVIRLEEQLRLAQLCSPSELAELESLNIRQYIGLRFASNPELPELARRAVREKLSEKQIKEAVKSWRADEYRV